MKYEYVKPVEGEAEYIRDGSGVSHALADVSARTAAEDLAVRCDKAESGITALEGRCDDAEYYIKRLESGQDYINLNLTSLSNELGFVQEQAEENRADIDVLKGDGEGSVEKTVTDRIAEVVANAPEDLNTLKEIAEWITSHKGSASEMNASIKQNAADIKSIQEVINIPVEMRCTEYRYISEEAPDEGQSYVTAEFTSTMTYAFFQRLYFDGQVSFNLFGLKERTHSAPEYVKISTDDSYTFYPQVGLVTDETDKILRIKFTIRDSGFTRVGDVCKTFVPVDSYITALKNVMLSYTNVGAFDLSLATGTLPIEKGGTGAVSATDARINLGLGSAAVKSYTSNIVPDSTDLITSGGIYSLTSRLDALEKRINELDGSAVMCSVSYDGEGVSATSSRVKKGTEITLKSAPERDGASFLGWLCSVDKETYEADTTYIVNSDVTFTAQWRSNEADDTRDYNNVFSVSEETCKPYSAEAVNKEYTSESFKVKTGDSIKLYISYCIATGNGGDNEIAPEEGYNLWGDASISCLGETARVSANVSREQGESSEEGSWSGSKEHTFTVEEKDNGKQINMDLEAQLPQGSKTPEGVISGTIEELEASLTINGHCVYSIKTKA